MLLTSCEKRHAATFTRAEALQNSVFSRHGKCRVYADLLGEGPGELVIRHTYSRKSSTRRVQGAGLGAGNLGSQCWHCSV